MLSRPVAAFVLLALGLVGVQLFGRRTDARALGVAVEDAAGFMAQLDT